jgi:hypothetical protein
MKMKRFGTIRLKPKGLILSEISEITGIGETITKDKKELGLMNLCAFKQMS